MGDRTYTNYHKRLKGEKVPTHDGEPDLGFYRKPTRTPRDQGNKITGWEPVVYYIDPEKNKLIGLIGWAGSDPDDDKRREMTANELADSWTFICAYPIPEAVYRNVAEGGKPWPRDLMGEPKQASRTAYPADNAAAAAAAATTNGEAIPAAGRTVERNDNQPLEVALAPEALLAEKIKNTIGAAVDLFDTKNKIYVIADDEELKSAGSYRNLLNESRLAAEKAKEAEYRPLKTKLDAVATRWNPVITLADDTAKAILKGCDAYNTKKLRDYEADQKRIAEENRKIEEANIRTLDRAIESGTAITVESLAPLVEPVKPAPVATVAVGHGRAMSVGTKKVATITDQALVYEHFKNHADVKALLLKLAQRDVDAGITVPGTTTATEARGK